MPLLASSTELEEGQAAYAQTLAQASRQHDMGALWALVHPESRACISDDFKAITEMMSFSRYETLPVPDNYSVHVEAVDPENIKAVFPMLYGEDVHIPVMPTHTMRIQYESRRGICQPVQVGKLIYIAPGGDGGWYEAMPCPVSMPMSAADVRVRNAKLAQDADDYYAAMDTEFKDKLRKVIIKNGARIQAMKMVQEKDGLDLATAKEVVDKFCDDNAATE